MARVGVDGFEGSRLRQARDARGVSVAALAEKLRAESLSCTPQAIYKWERGGAPRPEAVAALATVLGVPATFFLKAPVALDHAPTFFRSRMTATKTARNGASARLAMLVEVVEALEEQVELPAVALPRVEFPADPRDATDDHIERAALDARLALGLGHGPVPDVVALLEAHGVPVARASMGQGKLDAFSTWTASGRPIVFLNADKTAACRSRLDAAHELAHLLIHRGRVPVDVLDDKDLFETIERQAQQFAGAFLLPRAGIERELRILTVDGLLAAKPRWGASVGALLSRVQTLGMITPSAARWQWIVLSRRGWRTGEPLDDKLAPERPSLLRRAFEVLREAGVRPEHDLVVPPADIEELCALPPGYLTPTAAAPRVVLKSKEAPHHSS